MQDVSNYQRYCFNRENSYEPYRVLAGSEPHHFNAETADLRSTGFKGDLFFGMRYATIDDPPYDDYDGPLYSTSAEQKTLRAQPRGGSALFAPAWNKSSTTSTASDEYVYLNTSTWFEGASAMGSGWYFGTEDNRECGQELHAGSQPRMMESIYNQPGSFGSNSWNCSIYLGGLFHRYFYSSSARNSQSDTTTPHRFRPFGWHHWCWMRTYQQSAGAGTKVTLYIDGVKVYDAIPGTGFPNNVSLGLTFYSAQNSTARAAAAVGGNQYTFYEHSMNSTTSLIQREAMLRAQVSLGRRGAPPVAGMGL